MIFPSQTPIVLTPSDLCIPPEFIKSGDGDYDYGFIFFPGESEGGFGWSAKFTDRKLMRSRVSICGYPATKPPDSPWKSEGSLTQVTQCRLSYKIDTSWGQSGSPIYVDKEDYTVVGVHAYGGKRPTPNHGPRLIPEVISRFMRWTGTMVALKSVHFKLYIHCDTPSVDQQVADGSGAVKARCRRGNDWKFFLYPLEFSSSQAVVPRATKFVIECFEREGVYLGLDGQDIDGYEDCGGGVVSCRRGTGLAEQFYIMLEDDGVRSFLSVKFPHCRIQVEGKWFARGVCIGGGVCCQYYTDVKMPAENCEKFQIVPLPK